VHNYSFKATHSGSIWGGLYTFKSEQDGSKGYHSYAVLALLGYLKIIYFMKANICFRVLGNHRRFLLVGFFLSITIKIVISME